MEAGSRARRPLVVVVALVGVVAIVFGASVALGDLSESSHTREIVYPEPGTSKASCAGKKHVGFGGFFTDTQVNQQPYAWITGSAPAGKDVDRWETTGHNSSVAKPAKLRSDAYCFSGPKPTVKKHTTEVAAGPHSGATYGSSTATCPKSKTLIGGGFEIGIDDYPVAHQVVLLGFDRTANKRGMEIEVNNEDDEAIDLTAYVLCGKGKTAKPVAKTIDIEAPGRESATSNCPNGKEAVYGGFRGTYEDLGLTSFRLSTPMAMERSGKGSIKVTGYAVAGNEELVELEAIAFCR